MAESRFRLSWQLAIATIMVVTIGIIPVVVYFLDPMDLMELAISMVIGWSVLILIALMGAFFLGLAVGHRAASKSEFSPFEVEMLKMKEEVKALREALHKHNAQHGEAPPRTEEREVPEPEERPPERPVAVEPEPEPPAEPAPAKVPVGKVRCSQCRTVIPLYTKNRPLEVKCTNCGKVGVLR